MLYVLLALALFGLITSTVFAAMVLWAAPGYLRFRRAALVTLTDAQPLPPLSLIKPLHGADPGLEAYLVSFYEQNYPNFEILFCARTEHDAGLEIARKVAARYPHIPTQTLFTNGEPNYINAKVASMELMESAAHHEILVISDSDVRVTPDYLRAVALPFADPAVGGMTCLYRGVAAEGGLWARLEAVGMSVEMTAGVLVANMLEGMQFVLGPTMAFRRATLKKMGGFRVTADYCADDYVLGNQTFLQGERIVLSHHIIDHMVINASFIQSMRHQARWMQSTRFSRPKGHFGTSLTFSLPFGLLALIAAAALGHIGWGLALLGWSIATRLAISLAAGRAVVRDTSWLALIILYPIRDLMGIGFWAASYLSSKVLWRGRVFQLLPGGKMKAVAK
jgi:ceramide glucosyltransferase